MSWMRRGYALQMDIVHDQVDAAHKAYRAALMEPNVDASDVCCACVLCVLHACASKLWCACVHVCCVCCIHVL